MSNLRVSAFIWADCRFSIFEMIFWTAGQPYTVECNEDYALGK